MNKISIGEVSKILGVTPKTIRIWEQQGKIHPERTPNGHRRYDRDEIVRLSSFYGKVRHLPEESNKVTIAYARVSTSGQKEDLARQVELLESFCTANGWVYSTIQDLGSGLNYEKRGLKHLIKEICNGHVERLIITHKDRLLRFGSEIIFSLCEIFGTEVVVLNKGEPQPTFEEELAQDVLEIITVFSARLYGSRSHKNKAILKQLKGFADYFGSQNQT
jgi:putative resolvase